MKQNLFKPILALILVLGFVTNFSGQDLIITGVADGPLDGGTPKVLELYALNDIPDLSVYTVKNQANGNVDWGNAFSLSGTATMGDFIYVTKIGGIANFNSFFENTVVPMESDVVNVNGDDRIALFNAADEMVDLFGVDGEDGSGKDWEYKDGWAYRTSGSAPTATFNSSEWTFSGVDGLEGGITNATCSQPFAIGSFSAATSTDYTVTFSVTDGNNSLANANININGENLTTNASGQATIDLENGNYAYTAMLSGYDEVTGTVIVADAVVTEDVIMTATVAPIVFATLPYSEDFESGLGNFVLANGTEVNHWMCGPSDSLTGNALFITNDDILNQYTIAQESNCFAYLPINFNGLRDVDLTFDWVGNGEGGTSAIYDYLRVFLVPDTFIVEGGLNLNGYSSPYEIFAVTEKLTLNSIKQTLSVMLTPEKITQDQMKLVFYWRNDGSSGTQPPASFDNVSLTEITCPKPTGLTVGDYSATDLELSWTAGGSEWKVIYGATGFDPSSGGTTLDVTTNPYTITGLTAETSYDIYVKADCGLGDVSILSDKLTVTTASICPVPNDISVNDITSNSANISWSAYGMTEWKIKVSTTSIDPTTAEGDINLIITNNPYALFGLIDNTKYFVYLQSSCGSDWSSEFVFTTKCNPVTLPYLETFDLGTRPDCWSEFKGLLNTNVIPVETENCSFDKGFANATSNTKSARMNIYGGGKRDWLVTPTIDLGDGSTSYVLSFDLALTDYASTSQADQNGVDDKFAVVISTDNGLTWLDANTLRIWDNAGSEYIYNEIDSAGEQIAISLSSYTGLVKIAFYGESTLSNADNDLFVDNVQVREPFVGNDILTFVHPFLTAPADIDSENHTVTAEVAMGTGLIGLVPSTSVSDYATVIPSNGDTIDFTNSVIYTVTSETGVSQEWIVTVTEAIAQSSQKDILSFTLDEGTALGVIGLETIEVEAAWSSDLTALIPTITVSNLASVSPESGVSQDFTNPVIYTVTAEDGTTKEYTVIVTNAPAPIGLTCSNPLEYGSINSSEQLNTLSATENWWYSFTLDQKYADVKVSLCGSDFDTRLAIYDDCSDFSGGYGYVIGSDPNGALAYNDDACTSGDFGTGSSRASVCTLDTLPAGTYFALVYGHYISSNGDIRLEITGTTCPMPVNVEATNLTATTVTIAWEELLASTAWNLKVSSTEIVDLTTATADIFDGLVNTVSSQDITGLSPETTYYVYLQSDCGSAWTSSYSFTTTASCPVPTDLSVNFSSPTEAELSWNGYAASNWDIEWGLEGFDATGTPTIENVSDNPHTLTGLTSGTAYDYYVRANCGTEQSDWAGPFSFIYLAGDNCSNAEDLSTLTSPYSATTAGYTNDFNFCSMGSAADRIFYIDVETGYKIKIHQSSNNYDSRHSMRRGGSCPGDTVVKCIDELDTQEVEWLNTTGSTERVYWINSGYNSNQGDFVLEWTLESINSENDFLSYSFNEQISDALIDLDSHTITVEVGNGTDVSNIVATYTLSSEATATVNGVSQVSGTTTNDFTNPLVYTVTAEDGSVEQWEVTVTVAPVQTATDFISFTFPEATSNANINTVEKTIDIEVESCTDLSSLVADFMLSYGATDSLNGVLQISGITSNDYTNPVVFKVVAEDSTTIENWTVTVTDVPRILIDTFPWSEGFEGLRVPACWTVLDEDGDAQQWKIKDDAHQEGVQSIAVSYNTSGNNDWLITPQVKINEDNLHLDFYAKSTGSFLESYKVLVSKTGNEVSDFTIVLDSVVDAPNTWTNKRYKLSDFGINTGDSIYVAIQCFSVNEIRLYIDAFSILAISSEASLSDLTVDGTSVPSFAPSTLTYDVELPFGTTVIPSVAGTATDVNASVEETTTASLPLPSSTVLTVTAEDSITVLAYTVNFIEEVVSSEANLETYSLNNVSGNVNAANHTVSVVLPQGTDITSLVADFTLSPNATVMVNGVSQVSGTTANNFTNPVVYRVTAEDGTTTIDWTVTVDNGTHVGILESNELLIYPNPTLGQFTIEMNLSEEKDVVITIINSNGQIVRDMKFDNVHQFSQEFDMTNVSSGLYNIGISAGSEMINRKIVIK